MLICRYKLLNEPVYCFSNHNFYYNDEQYNCNFTYNFNQIDSNSDSNSDTDSN